MTQNANFAPGIYSGRTGVDISKQITTDPKSWFSKHAVAMDFAENQIHSFADPKVNPTAALVAGATADSLSFPVGFRFDAVYISGGGTKPQLSIKTSNEQNDKGVRGLPFKDNKVTYTQMDPAARFFITGPLTGCHVYVAGTKAAPWIFHANKNADDASVSQNMVAKLRSTLSTIAGLGLNAGIAGSLIRSDYSQKGYGGFVFGHFDGNSWRFWTYLADPELKKRKVVSFPVALT